MINVGHTWALGNFDCKFLLLNLEDKSVQYHRTTQRTRHCDSITWADEGSASLVTFVVAVVIRRRALEDEAWRSHQEGRRGNSSLRRSGDFEGIYLLLLFLSSIFFDFLYFYFLASSPHLLWLSRDPIVHPYDDHPQEVIIRRVLYSLKQMFDPCTYKLFSYTKHSSNLVLYSAWCCICLEPFQNLLLNRHDDEFDMETSKLRKFRQLFQPN